MGQAELDVDVEVDDVVELLDPDSGSPPGGGPVGRLNGFTNGPVHPGGGKTTGVMPLMIPTSAGGQPLIIPPKSTLQILPVPPQRERSPGGPVTTTGGEVLFGGIVIVEDHVTDDVSGAV